MKSILFTTLFIFFQTSLAWSWGQNGHRIVGEIAQRHLSKKTQKKVTEVLNGQSIAMVSNYMDFIKSNPSYKHLNPWHYCTIPDSLSYTGAPKEGDVIQAIIQLEYELKTKKFTQGDEAFTLACLIHLVGDLHQPLHVGNGTDKGGNDVQVNYFWEDHNLHWVWDEGIIDRQQLSYTEYVAAIDTASNKTIKTWQSSQVLDWANESKALRMKEVYDFPSDKKLSWRYNYDHIATVNTRLQQAGIRLAYLLTDIYGN